MRKFSIVALMALCFTFPGKVEANLNYTQSQIIFAQGEMDPALVESILRYVQVEYGYDYNCLCEMHKNGSLTIEKDPQGYLVRIVDGGGIITTILDNSGF